MTVLFVRSPRATSLAAQWVEPPGTGWVSLTAYHHDTRQRFDSRGDEQPFFAEGHAIATSLYISSAVGVVQGLDVWAEIPFHRLQFDDVVDERTSTGIGDPRFWLRLAPLRFVGSDFPLALRAGVKLPAGDFPIDAEVIPLGEGQRDWEVIVEVGHSFYPAPHYVMAWLGHRWREEEEKTLRDWGDERFFLAQVGGSLGSVGYKVLAEGWTGDTPIIEGIPVPSASREFAQVTPSLTYAVGPGQLEAGVRLPIGGHNLPAGHALVLGYFFTWSW
ncbi:MAG TPA: hypothetical protein VLL48_10160 [Longimicrobiales bacterium]|nr:hypothetical protein [Longimicrobiales bacterium]